MNIFEWLKTYHKWDWQRVLMGFSVFAGALTTMLSLLITVWLIWPYNVLKLNTPVYTIENKNLKRGDYVVMKADYCKYMDIQANWTPSFVDGIVLDLPERHTNLEMGCHKTDILIGPISEEMGPGTYHVSLRITYKVNPVREITYTYRSEEFNVTDK